MRKTASSVKHQASSDYQKARGVSLVELLVVIAIFSLISAALIAVMGSAQTSWSTGSSQAMVTSGLRKALDRMSRELVASKSSEINWPPVNPVGDDRWYPTLTFRVPEDRSVPPDGSVLDANGAITEWSDWIIYRSAMIQRSIPSIVRDVQPAGGPVASTEILATRIANLLFRRQNATPDVVEISMTAFSVTDAGHYMPRTMGTRIKLRNG